MAQVGDDLPDIRVHAYADPDMETTFSLLPLSSLVHDSRPLVITRALLHCTTVLLFLFFNSMSAAPSLDSHVPHFLSLSLSLSLSRSGFLQLTPVACESAQARGRVRSVHHRCRLCGCVHHVRACVRVWCDLE